MSFVVERVPPPGCAHAVRAQRYQADILCFLPMSLAANLTFSSLKRNCPYQRPSTQRCCNIRNCKSSAALRGGRSLHLAIPSRRQRELRRVQRTPLLVAGVYSKEVAYDNHSQMPDTSWAERAYTCGALDPSLGQSMSFPSLLH